MPTPTITQPRPTVVEVTDPWTERPVVGKFRVLNGVHSEGSIPGTYRQQLDAAGNPVDAPLSKPRIYTHGEIVASRSDLEKHNPAFGEKKFERVSDDVPDKYDAMEQKRQGVVGVQPEEEQSLESMTILQLRKVAEDEEIEVGNDWKKQEIVDWIKQSRG